MPATADRAATEAAVLGTVRDLLTELGSQQAAGRVALDSSFDRDLGLGSLERVELLVRLESALGVHLPENHVQAAETPSDWVRLVCQAGSPVEPASRWPIVQPSREAYEPPASACTFVEILRAQAERDPARLHAHLLDGDTGQDISHGQLFASASRVAAGLAESGLRPGETVAIMLPTCADFFSSFLGVMLAGGIAVPVYPPAKASQLEQYIRRQSLILRNAGVRFLVSFDRIQAVTNVLGGTLPSLRESLTAAELEERGSGRPVPDREPAETCFIQYTSGSTGNPKGVVLTHGNVIANIQGIGFAVEVKPSDFVVSWLPLYHDMGLIGSWLFSLYHGLPITVMSPLDFLVRPERWLWALGDSRGTLCPAPNFAFELCVRKISDEMMEGVDLSPWRVAINAGEPVLPATLERFAERFAPWGFDSRAFMPFFGLAESTVALTYPPFWRGPVVDRIDRVRFETEGHAEPTSETSGERALRFVGNGKPLPGHEIKIVDEQGRELPDRVRGRLLFRGPSRTGGYFRNDKATAEVLDSDGWMDSGDLGYLADGELYVTGRLKDCIIKGGRNIIPQDVEMAAWEAEGVRKGCVAAFGTVDPQTGTESLVVVAETRSSDSEDRKRIQAAVIEAVAARIGVPPDDVVLAHVGAVPKTSSGKIQRTETRGLYEQGSIESRPPAGPWLQLAKLWLRSATHSSAASATRFGRQTRLAAKDLLGGSLAVGFGLVARLLPAPTAARYAVAPGARILAALQGVRASGTLGGNGPQVTFVGRAHRLDALLVAASFRSAFVFADRTGFQSLGSAEAFLLEPLVASPARNGASTLQGRMESALASGWTVASLADCAVGEPPARNRFRAEGFFAAASSGAPAVPAALRPEDRGSFRAVQGPPVNGHPSGADLAASRASVRTFLLDADGPGGSAATG